MRPPYCYCEKKEEQKHKTPHDLDRKQKTNEETKEECRSGIQRTDLNEQMMKVFLFILQNRVERGKGGDQKR
jgi:uncharacterized protein (DUF608 family)